MPRFVRLLSLSALLLSLSSFAAAQATAPASSAPAAGPQAVTPTVRKTLQMLQDRPQTLKDFKAKIDYDVYHQETVERDGKRGTVDFVNDPKTGPEFSARFTIDTVDGEPVKKHLQDVVFDGSHVTLIDHSGKTYTRRSTLAPGAKPGDATSLNGGQVTLPIGLKVSEVLDNFDVTEQKSPSPEDVVLKLVPHPNAAGKFDFKSLEMTVDKKLQLPMKVVRTETNGDITTIQFSDPQINTGKAQMVDTTVPTGSDWTIDLK